MKIKLKKLRDQVVVITGATSGIGLATARLAASHGAAVVLAARNERSLREIIQDIRSRGGRASYAVADVTDPRAVEHIGAVAFRDFGGFDTWVNNAGLSIYGKLTEVPMLEKRRLMDVNFWGVVHGCRVAVKHLREKGGAIINIGSVVSERAMPLQGIYCASKFAIRAYTDTLRMELEEERLPISVSLVKPAGIDTPFVEHARNHMDVLPKYPPPVYHPDTVARAILFCAAHFKRDLTVGGAGVTYELGERLAPRLTDKVMEYTMFSAQRSDLPPNQEDSLFRVPEREGKERGAHRGRVHDRSAYTDAMMHPMAAGLLALGAGALTLLGMRWLSVAVPQPLEPRYLYENPSESVDEPGPAVRAL